MYRHYSLSVWLVARRLSLLLLAESLAWIGCTGGGADSDTSASGKVRIAADVSLKPALEPLVESFHRTYPKARIEIIYTSEAQAVDGLLADSFQVAIVARSYTPSDSIALVEQKIRPKKTKIVREGIAVIGFPERKDSTLPIDTLISWLLNPQSPYTFVIEGGGGSGILRYLKDTLLRGEMPKASLYRADSAPAVIAYVQQNPRAIGLIGAAWVCDREDTTVAKFLRTVRLFALAPRGKREFYQPYAGYLREGYYPLSRDVYALNREPRFGLGSRFVSYAAGPDGQRILLKSELLPANAPVRIVELKEEEIRIEKE
ncbi:MAG: substrate-binding domain-containing protein [Bacteroidia bacterium]|nr:substrate-binding domain-containing protein [Bacteroidia bacterium]